MKRILSIICAGAALVLALASCEKHEKAIFDTSKITAPVMGTTSVSAKSISVDYTPAEYNLSFNQGMGFKHTLALILVGEKTVSVRVPSTDSGTNLKAAATDLSDVLLKYGYDYGDVVKVELVVRATIQDLTKDNGVNGFVDSEATLVIDEFKLVKPSGGTYADYTKDSPWSVIGSIASTGNGWNQDEAMMSNGTWHVCEGIELTTSDQFKFRKDADWGTNFGAGPDITEEPYVVTLDTELPAGAGGKNLAVPADGKYDLLLNPDAAVYKIVEHKEDPYAAFTKESTWSVIGSIASTGNGWNQDEEMVSDGTWHVCKSLELTTGDQFKFRKDADWGTNFGAGPDITEEPYVVTIGEELPAGAGGKNLAVPADGTYDLLLNPDAAVYKIVPAGAGL